MIYDEVTQDRTEAGSGNCTEATIASILRVPLVSVPDLWTGSFEEPRSDERWLALHAWLKKQGKKIAYIEYKNTYPRLIYPEVYGELQDVVRVDRPHGVAGISPNGVPHYCVGLNGKVVWDPNPSRKGLAQYNGLLFIIDNDKLYEHMQSWPTVSMVWGPEA
tara:strand:- start:4203 stop:4688 length:486 start_codon:yes stop_codon:yes gene_type:complete